MRGHQLAATIAIVAATRMRFVTSLTRVVLMRDSILLHDARH